MESMPNCHAASHSVHSTPLYIEEMKFGLFMKKLILAVAAAALMIPASAQSLKLADGVHYGVVGGFTSSNTNIKDISSKSIALYHAGATVKVNLGLGFAIQPSLIYQVKGAKLYEIESSGLSADVKDQIEYKLGYLELPVNIQWGPDLVAFRPFVFAEPFIGYGLNNDIKENIILQAQDVTIDEVPETAKNVWKDYGIKRFEYGLGLGAGFEFWRIQISAQWFWNFGSLYDTDADKVSSERIYNNIKGAFADKKNFQGVKVSLGILF